MTMLEAFSDQMLKIWPTLRPEVPFSRPVLPVARLLRMEKCNFSREEGRNLHEEAEIE